MDRDAQFAAQSANIGFGLAIAATASRSLAGVIFRLRPPLRSLARAEARPQALRDETLGQRSRQEPLSPIEVGVANLFIFVVLGALDKLLRFNDVFHRNLHFSKSLAGF